MDRAPEERINPRAGGGGDEERIPRAIRRIAGKSGLIPALVSPAAISARGIGDAALIRGS